VSSKYSILASLGPIVSTPSRISQGNFPKLNKLRAWPGTRLRGFDDQWTAFMLAATCWLIVAGSDTINQQEIGRAHV